MAERRSATVMTVVGLAVVAASVVGSSTTGVVVPPDGFDETLILFGVEYSGRTLSEGLWWMWGLRLLGLVLVVVGIGMLAGWWSSSRTPRRLALGGVVVTLATVFAVSTPAGAPKSEQIVVWVTALVGGAALVAGVVMRLLQGLRRGRGR